MIRKKSVYLLPILVMLIIPIMIQIPTIKGGGGQEEQSFTTIKCAFHESELGSYWDTYAETIPDFQDYQWTVNNTGYKIKLIYTTTDDTLSDYDELIKYDVLIVYGQHSEPYDYFFASGEDKDEWEEINDNLRNFIINDGRGYLGHCGGAAWAVELINDVKTWEEKTLDSLSFLKDDIGIKALFYAGQPVLDEYCYPGDNFLLRVLMRINFRRWIDKIDNKPTYVGNNAYWQYQIRDYGQSHAGFGGVPINLEVRDENHPIFSDYLDDSWLVRWNGGPGFLLPRDDNPEISDLAGFQSGEEYMSDNENTKIYAWTCKPQSAKEWHEFGRYIKKYFQRLIDKSVEPYSLDEFVSDLYIERRNLTDWWPTNYPIKPDSQEYPALVAIDFSKSQQNGGRVALSAVHPEYSHWNRTGNYIDNVINTTHNKQWEGLIEWRNDMGTPEDKEDYRLLTQEEDYIYENEWFLRREVAWASGQVPDEHMPPVYGRSHAVDINHRYQNDSNVTIICGLGGGPYGSPYNNYVVNLSLYYRYNATLDGANFTNWTYYDSIDGLPYRFYFNSSNANGSGQYQFCTRLTVDSDPPEHPLVYEEDFPPGPDANCIIGNIIAADFTYHPISPYSRQNITFNDTSYTSPNSHFISYQWDFGDGNTSTDQNTTYQYADNGTYIITHNVTNNLTQTDSISKTIIVRNVPPDADFTPIFSITKINESINFTDISTDIDGNIVSWLWDFGDGTNSTSQNTSHIYNTSNCYTITLTVTDNDGAFNMKYRPNCVLIVDGIVNGSLSSDDPQNQTWTKIQKGIDNLTTTNILYVVQGNYSEDIVINKSMVLIGQNKNKVLINGSIEIENPRDYELPEDSKREIISDVNMTGNHLLYHFNNDSDVGENYSNQDVVYDYSGWGNNGALNGAIWINTSLKGSGAFIFNGISNTINITNISALIGENVSISAWINWVEGSGQIDPIISQSNSSDGYCLYINCTDNKPAFRLGNDIAKSPTTINNGWHHIVGIHNETVLQLYIDGSLKDTTTKTGSGISTNAYVGFDNVNNYYNGTIDEIAVWNRTLSGEEISIIYNLNYGVAISGFTIKNGEIGVRATHHSDISDCNIVNHTSGIMIDNLSDVRVECNISDCGSGIRIINSNPDEYGKIRVIDCIIENVTEGIVINSSSYINIIRVFLNCSGESLNISGSSDYDTIIVVDTDSYGNEEPQDPGSPFGPKIGAIEIFYDYESETWDSEDNEIFYMFDWGDGTTSGWDGPYSSNITVNLSHNWSVNGGYYIKVKSKDIFNSETKWSESLLFRTETNPPEINSVNYSSNTIGFGYNKTFTVNATDNQIANDSGIKNVSVNITYPDNSYGNYTFTSLGNDTYQYLFSDTWLTGQYNCTIWTMDNAYNSNSSSGYNFNVTAQANITVCTVKDSYGDNETLNLTDPPGDNSGYTIQGNSVVWDNDYARLEVSPHTSNNVVTQTQYANVLWKDDDTSIDVAFRFDNPLSNKDIWMWKNISHNITVVDYGEAEYNYTLTNITDYTVLEETPEYVDYGDIPSEHYAMGTIDSSQTYTIGFDSKEWLDEEHTSAKFFYHKWGPTGDHIETVYYPDWKNIKNQFQHTIDNNKHYYYVNDFAVEQDQTYQFKWQYNTPAGSNGKWELLAKLHSDTIEEAFSSGRYVMIDPWWNSSWNYHRSITIDKDYIDNSLTDFPVLVVVNSTVGSKCDGGDSIRFLDEDNSTEFYYEIEKWDSSGDSYVWVNISNVLSSDDTVFYMYYNNSDAVDNQNPSSVWHSNYMAVWHLNNLSDSTSNNVDLSNYGADLVDGKVGSCYRFNKSETDWLNHTTFTDTGVPSSFTIELWMYNYGNDDESYLIDKYNVNAQDHYTLRVSSDQFMMNTEGGNHGNDYATAPNTLTDNTWEYGVGIHNSGSALKAYHNLSSASGDTGWVIQDGTDYDFHIGCAVGQSVNFVNGSIDEIRFSNIERNASYLKACFHSSNQSSGFLSWGSEVTNLPPEVSNPYPSTGSENITIQPRLNITVYDRNGDSMTINWLSNSTITDQMLTLRPDGAGNTTKLNKFGDSTNWECVDDVVPDNLSTYVSHCATTWAKDCYNVSNHTSESGDINSVTVRNRGMKGGMGYIFWSVDNVIKPVLYVNDSYYYGNETNLTTSWALYNHTWTTNPATGLSWTWDDIDDLQAGVALKGDYKTGYCTQVYVEVNYSGNQWLSFGVNNSVYDGVYHQAFSNATVNGQWWYWKVNVSDGNSWTESDVYSFYTGQQSKIENTGSTNISGYLLIQAQYWNSTSQVWVVASDTVNETTPRTITAGTELGLDTVFNGIVNTSDLPSGPSKTFYRVYAAFRDPDGNVLINDYDEKLEAWWKFSKAS